ncbi:MAG: NAD(P)H-hydrate dehydratase [Balneola sp.]|nr:MAG: NAD(P)H-hydrate dehydratase [Balneola sp.]
MNIPHSYQLFTAQSSRELDERTISEFGIDGFTLMEIAGTRAADFILQTIESQHSGLFLCGKGNNAGDALVVARILSEAGISCTIYFVFGTENLSPDCTKNLDLLKKLGNDVHFLSSLEELENSAYDFIVDGIFGTGLSSEIKSPTKEVIEWVNKQHSTTFSMDIPSGLNADTGEIEGATISADYTLAFGTLKKGFYLDKAYDVCGDIVLCELPFPSGYKTSSTFLIDQVWVDQNRENVKRAHKYDGGVVYIIAGSEGLTGAAALASQSAWSSGVGGVVLITPKGLLDVYEKSLVQIIKRPLGNDKDVFFDSSHLDSVLEILREKPGVLLIGPGLGRSPETVAFVQSLLSQFEGDLVIDADALFALSEHSDLQKPERANWILTPHPGELKKLAEGFEMEEKNRLELGTSLSTKLNATILSKGLPSQVINNQQVLMTGYDTRIFSRAGFGDVLAGKVAGFWLSKKNRELACCFALLDGKEKADTHSNTSTTPLEPIHLI